MKKLYRCQKCGSTHISKIPTLDTRVCDGCGARYNALSEYVDNPSSELINKISEELDRRYGPDR